MQIPLELQKFDEQSVPMAQRELSDWSVQYPLEVQKLDWHWSEVLHVSTPVTPPHELFEPHFSIEHWLLALQLSPIDPDVHVFDAPLQKPELQSPEVPQLEPVDPSVQRPLEAQSPELQSPLPPHIEPRR